MSIPSALSPSVDLAKEAAGIRAQQREGDLEGALDRARALLVSHPQARDIMLVEAFILRRLGHIDQALAALDRLASGHPRFSLMWQERGLCHVARKDSEESIRAFLEAVAVNPALPQSWRMLEGLYLMLGDAQNAANAGAHSATLRGLPQEVVSATSLFADGELETAEAMTRSFLLSHGDHPEAMRLLARIGIAREVWDDAEILLAGVLAIEPDYAAARLDYARTLSQRYKHAEAAEALAPLLAAEPQNSEFRTLQSAILVGLGRQHEAIALYRDLLTELPAVAGPGVDAAALAAARADLNLWLGHALKTMGDLPDAIAAYHQAIAARGDFGDAWWSLANLKTYRFDDASLETMSRAADNGATPTIDQLHLCFALGKAYEDRGDFKNAWVCYSRGNALKRGESRYRPAVFETNTAEQKRVCTAPFLAARADWGCPDPDPIFIVGLPRSGSTLIEQILASHPQVEGTQELPDIQRFALEFQGRDPDLDHPLYPGVLAQLSPDQCRALGQRYLDGTRALRVAGRPFFIDKMPNNFRHLGLIRLILPNAKIIDARREPMACCFSNLKQLFAQGQEFSYSVQDIARYYRTYLDLMRHWDEAMPGAVLRVINEDVISDLEGQVRRLLAHCGLPFDPACLAFHETRRAVRTPSSEQVRQPINRDGVDQWRNFAPWLAELSSALGDAVENWRN